MGHEIITKLQTNLQNCQWIFKSIALWQMKFGKILESLNKLYCIVLWPSNTQPAIKVESSNATPCELLYQWILILQSQLLYLMWDPRQDFFTLDTLSSANGYNDGLHGTRIITFVALWHVLIKQIRWVLHRLL